MINSLIALVVCLGGRWEVLLILHVRMYHIGVFFTVHMLQACLIIARISSCSREIMEADDLSQYLGWTISQLSSQQEYLECVSKALMTFLKKDAYRLSFYEANGVKP